MGATASVFRTADIRNIALAGHGGCGKTTLTDAICYIAGSSHRRGSVREGTAITDYTPEEVEHRISINLSVAHAVWMNTKLNLIDTPGYLDFFGEAVAGVRAADGVLLVVNGQHGVEVGTERVWDACRRRGLPGIFFVSMMDRENASFEKAFRQIREALTPGAIPVEVPIGSGEGFRGIVNLFSQRAHIYRPGSDRGEYDEADIPDELQPAVEKYRNELIETVAASDDSLLEAYLEGEKLDRDQVIAGLGAAMRRGELFPVFCGSAETGRGVRAVLSKLAELLPSPEGAGSVLVEMPEGEAVELAATDDAPFSAQVFKTTSEPHVGELSYFRVFSGSLANGQTVYNASRAAPERIAHLSIPQGSGRTEVERLHAGDIGVVAKLRDTHTGDTLCSEAMPVALAAIEWPAPDISIAIRPTSRGEEDRLANALAKLHEEDPTFRAAYEPEIGQTVARGLGELHLTVTLERMRRKYAVSVETEEPRIPYRETITRVAEGQGRYKKQTGGRGQFGDCWVRLRPLPRGSGYNFENRIVGGVIPGKFVPAVDKGIQEAAARGILAGYPVVDFQAECYDGSHHSVDSSEQAFRVAGSLAFQKVAKEARPILLEPIMTITVKTPEEYMGDVIGDLNQRRGRILGVEADGHWQIVKATVPLAELYKYSATLRSLTQGKGMHSREFAGYEPAPPHVTEKVVQEAQAGKEEAAVR